MLLRHAQLHKQHLCFFFHDVGPLIVEDFTAYIRGPGDNVPLNGVCSDIPPVSVCRLVCRGSCCGSHADARECFE